MRRALARAIVNGVTLDDRIDVLEVQEFRLHAADTSGAAARIVAEFTRGIEPSVPLLTSIDDGRDVATVRGLHAGEATEGQASQRDMLDGLVESWRPAKHYAPRIAERSGAQPSHFRLALTESGINNSEAAIAMTPRDATVTAAPLGLLWIGNPVDTYAGLMVLLGGMDETMRPEVREWPLLLGRSLGVRIYESSP